MRRESHVRFCEGGGVRLPSATRLVRSIKHECLNQVIRSENAIYDGRSPSSSSTATASRIIKVFMANCKIPEHFLVARSC